MAPRREPFGRVALAGALFQGGAAATDPATIVASLAHGLTQSAFWVAAAAAVVRLGWLAPQLFVAYWAAAKPRMPFYRLGAFGRATALAAVALLLAAGGSAPGGAALAALFILWTAYAFIAGVVAVPYNDIVARHFASERRSRLLAARFLGGGLLALVVAGLAERALAASTFPLGHAAVLGLGAALLVASAACFVSAGEPPLAREDRTAGFGAFLAQGLETWRRDARFRWFVATQWAVGLAALATPLYVVAAGDALAVREIAWLLGAQTLGALLANPSWGAIGDRRGKLALLSMVTLLSLLPPALVIAWFATGGRSHALAWFGGAFFLLGAASNGAVIAQLGYLMEISPDAARPAYSGYFNMLVAPATLSPLVGAGLAGIHPAAPFAAALALGAAAAAAVGRLSTFDRGAGAGLR
ncbi:MAG: MFS transporter [Betaproteobacteria bacterium]|nr:MFS transporter [Betaproteobacteria bacterium]